MEPIEQDDVLHLVRAVAKHGDARAKKTLRMICEGIAEVERNLGQHFDRQERKFAAALKQLDELDDLVCDLVSPALKRVRRDRQNAAE